MSTISLAPASTKTTHPAKQTSVKQAVLVDAVVNLATAATTKGSALANSDVIEALRIPAESVVLFAGFEVTVAGSGGTSDQTITLGDGVDPNRWVDTFDLDAASAGDHGTLVIGTTNPTYYAAADTIDIAITGGTTISTAGKIRVYAYIIDVKDRNAPGLAALGS